MGRHKLHDDLQAMLTGTLLAAFGIVLFNEGGLLAGGTVGLSLLLNYSTGLELSLSFVLANAPFYALACWRMGREFTFKTITCVSLTALFVHVLPRVMVFSHVSPLAAAVFGGLLVGVGILVLFRHTASLGGLNVLVLYAHKRWGASPGRLQLALDAAILLGGALALGDFRRLLPSILAVTVLNMVLAFNHRPGRYSPAT
ncbi:YitT family protein [Ramlibacter solisilvae]|uniref:Uncharacterized protein n=1 Tax=Ramlibacter tataouinensis TaxID=94132 RepID=A0A127JXZ2_9BURK|nr:YitT family protein [Ramlibacter tataouinensis]AMO24765.1 hypothetical protein UC35_20410 [Ramlibacter tataouinensis]